MANHRTAGSTLEPREGGGGALLITRLLQSKRRCLELLKNLFLWTEEGRRSSRDPLQNIVPPPNCFTLPQDGLTLITSKTVYVCQSKTHRKSSWNQEITLNVKVQAFTLKKQNKKQKPSHEPPLVF